MRLSHMYCITILFTLWCKGYDYTIVTGIQKWKYKLNLKRASFPYSNWRKCLHVSNHFNCRQKDVSIAYILLVFLIFYEYKQVYIDSVETAGSKHVESYNNFTSSINNGKNMSLYYISEIKSKSSKQKESRLGECACNCTSCKIISLTCVFTE